MIGASRLALALLLCATFALAQTQPPTPPQGSPDRFISEGEIALRQDRYAEAKGFFERAEKLAGADIAEVNAGIAMADLELGQYQASRERETKVLQLVSEPHERAEAHNLIGTAWLREYSEGPPDPAKLRAAEQEFRQAVAFDPVFDSAYFNLATALSQLGLDADAAFRESVDAASKNPASAVGLPFQRQGTAPLFTASDREGKTIPLRAQQGRFVLLDFWATWCGPCIHALPIVRQLATYFSPDDFVLLSIDEDYDNRGAWESFVSERTMTWAQIWDADSDVYYSFGFAPRPQMVIPRYVLVDPQGFVLHVYTGTDRIGVMAGQIVRTVYATRPPRPPVK